MSNNIKFLSIAIVAIVLFGGGFYLTREKSQNEPVTITKEEQVTIRVLEGYGIYPWEVVKKITGKDLLKEENVRIEYIPSVQATGGTDVLQAVLANNVDYGSGATPVWLNAISAGAKLKAVRGTELRYNWIVLENSSIYTTKDFVGKKIAVNVLGAFTDYATRYYLKNNALPIDSVQLIVVPSAQQEQVLRTGQVDISAVGESAYQVAKARGGIRLVATGNELVGKNLFSGLRGFREDFIKAHPEAVRKFVLVYEKSNRIIWDELQKNPESVKKAVAEILKEQDKNPKEANYYIPEFVPDHPFVTDTDVQWWIDRFIEDGKLKEGQIKPSDVYTNEFNPYYKK